MLPLILVCLAMQFLSVTQLSTKPDDNAKQWIHETFSGSFFLLSQIEKSMKVKGAKCQVTDALADNWSTNWPCCMQLAHKVPAIQESQVFEQNLRHYSPITLPVMSVASKEAPFLTKKRSGLGCKYGVPNENTCTLSTVGDQPLHASYHLPIKPGIWNVYFCDL